MEYIVKPISFPNLVARLRAFFEQLEIEKTPACTSQPS